MDWIDKNLDAYRVIAEILTDLRPIVRERLEARHGKEWFKDGIPEPIFERLIQNKEQEASIDWYENRYQEIISYAVFPDLFEIIITNPGLFDPILKLAPSQSLLNTRFLELEVMRSKIGRAREISDAEINFLTSFHLRFRKAVQELRGDEVTPPPAERRSPKQALKQADPPLPEAEPVAAANDTASAAPAPEATSAEPKAAQDEGTGAKRRDTKPRPPMRLASPAAAPETDEPVRVPESDAEDAVDAATEPAADSGAPEVRETTATIVKRAMENGDDPVVLRELYREVTGIAEVIWSTNEIPTTAVWDRVSTNTWYERNFSKLELRPLSDFYELISKVRQKRKDGAAKSEIQSFLNDSKFATILLALRDMFQKNNL